MCLQGGNKPHKIVFELSRVIILYIFKTHWSLIMVFFFNSKENKNESLVMFDFSRERAREVNKSEFMGDFYSSDLIQPHSSDKGILIKKTSVWITLKNSYSGVESGPLRSAKHGHKCHELSQRCLPWLSVRHTETSNLQTQLHALVAFIVLSS